MSHDVFDTQNIFKWADRNKNGPIYPALGGWVWLVGVRGYIEPFGLALTQLYPTQRFCQEFFNYFSVTH
jgi:hypothetical protein